MTLAAENTNEKIPDVWSALADPTRRILIDRLANGPRSTSQLGVGLAMSRFGVMKHLAVLERAGLITTRKHGRVRLNHLNAAALSAATMRWLSPRAASLSDGVAALARLAGDPSMTQPLPVLPLGAVEIALDWTVRSTRKRVWDLFVGAPEVWWPRSHRAVDGGFSFEATLGGRLVERVESGAGVVWYEVFGISPGASIDLRGALAARYGGPATSLLHVEFDDVSSGACRIKLTDSVFGRLGPDFYASVASGWEAIFGGLLVNAERGGER